jgi:uncharacterized protein
MTDDRQLVGHIRAVYRHPVKSMRAEPMREADIGWHGIEGDRRYAFVKSESMTGFPWLTGREVPEMVLYSPRYTNPENWRDSEVMVTLPDGRDLPITSPDLLNLLKEAYGRPTHLMFLSRGCYDAMPMSLISTATLDAFANQVGRSLDARRFRPNVLVDLVDAIPFGEDAWLNGLIQLGEGKEAPQLRISRQNVRCAMPNIDPDTAERDARVLKTIVQMREELAGL